MEAPRTGRRQARDENEGPVLASRLTRPITSGEGRWGHRTPSRGRDEGAEEIEELERRPAPRQDYDWYDKNGMKVRVREI